MTKNPSWIQFTDDIWGEAVGGTDHNDWLCSLDAPTLPAALLDPLPDVNAPLRQGWIAEQAKELVEAERMRVIGPHEPTWVYRSGIVAEISRLALACRESTGTEGEANLRLLRGAEAALREFDSTPEFHEAIRHALNVVGGAIASAGCNLSPEQIAAKERYAAIRASLEAIVVQREPAPPVRGEVHQADPVRRGRPRSNAPERLEEILVALESYAANTEQEFDRSAMPGPLGEDWNDQGSFHWLCAQIDPVFKKAKSTFEKRRAGLCAIHSYAPKTDFYKQALPYIAPTLKRGVNVYQMPQRRGKVA